MKIQVVRVDGNIETINLVGKIVAYEPSSDLEFPRNQSPLSVEATGMDYFFREDGRYDGWGMGCDLPKQEAESLVQAIQADREIEQKETP
jgi:hypothetical protein